MISEILDKVSDLDSRIEELLNESASDAADLVRKVEEDTEEFDQISEEMQVLSRREKDVAERGKEI